MASWPVLAEDSADANAYCRSIERRLRELSVSTGRRPSVAPLHVERLIEYARERGLDPGGGPARSRLAAELDRRGEAVLWPPGRNDACWCGLRSKYKRCCGQAPPQDVGPARP